MRIVELGDCCIVIEKEPEDREGFTIGSMFEDKTNPLVGIFAPNNSFEIYRTRDYIYTDDTLILYFKIPIPPEFKVNTHVGLKVGRDWYETYYEDSGNW